MPIGKIMLQGNFAVADFIRAAKLAYIRVAISHLFPAGARVNVSRLSVVTGLTRKEVAALVSRSGDQQNKSFASLKKQRALRVLNGWTIDPRFRGSLGEPAKLSPRGERRSFALLVKLYGGDVTPNSVLRELERMRAVRQTKSGHLLLRAVPDKRRSSERLTELAQVFADLANTLLSHAPNRSTPESFGFRDSLLATPDQAARFERVFSNRAAVMLEGADQWFEGQKERTGTSRGSGRFRVGIGVYLIKGISPDTRLPCKNESVRKLRTNHR
jgi:hypothetical protein